MAIQFSDGSLDGIQLDGVVLKAQGLDDAGNVLAFADGKTESDVTVKHTAYRILRADNHYRDLHRYALLNFQLPTAATQWKLDFSKIQRRSCTPEPVQGKVADVPDVSKTNGEGGNGYTIVGNCKIFYSLSGVIKGLNGDLEISTSDTQKKTITSTGADTTFEITVDTIKDGVARNMTEVEIEDFATKVQLIDVTAVDGSYWTTTGEVTVATNPTGQTCTITNGKKEVESIFYRSSPQGFKDDGTYNVGGHVAVRNYLPLPIMNDVSIACVDNPVEGENTEYSLSVNVTGLTSGILKLRNNINLNSLDVIADGTHLFSQAITANDGYDYDVRILAQPIGHTCVLTGDVDTATDDVTVSAVCTLATSPTSFRVGGTIDGLSMLESVTIRLTYGPSNATEELTITDDPIQDQDPFQFLADLSGGEAYSISVVTQPGGSTTCNPGSNASGNISSANITDALISCM
jgi:hypothetical protein